MSNFNNQQNSQYGYAPPGTYGPPGSLPPNPSFGSSYGPPGQVPGGQPFQPPTYNPPQSSSTRPGGYQPPPSMGSGSPYAGANPSNSFPPPSSANPVFNPAAVTAKAPAGRPLFFSTATGAPIAATSVPTSVAGPPASMMPPPPVGGSVAMPPPPSGPPLSNAAGPGIAPSVGFGGAAGAMPGPPSLPVGVSGFPRAGSMTNMPVGFDTGSGTNLHGMSVASNNPVDPNPIQATASSQGAPLPLIDEMDLSIQCNPIFLRPSVTKIVGSQATANACKIPLGIICKPMAGDVGTDNDEIEVVDFGATGIVRCKRCRTYINPYVTWADNGRRWRCNICGLLNDVPSTYFSHLDNSGQRRDKDQRPELSRCSVEFVAPGDYMVRPPQAPVYFFVIDVSENAVQSGMLASMASSIKQSLDDLPGSSRTQIGFITFDSHIHFYNLNSKLSSPQMIVVSEIVDVILPLPEDLLVNLKDSRSVVDSLLDSLPSMFKTSASTTNCLGPALNAAKKVIQHMGGKIVLFVSSLPQIGEGALKNRDNPRLLGTDKEHTLLNAEEQWYKTNAIDLSRLQICVDTFMFAPQYTDMATISHLSKFTAGNTYYYPSFSYTRDGKKFEAELKHVLLRATAFEAVMRVRATRGLRFSNFYGNYFIRGTDLLALPNCTSDSTFSLDIAYEEGQLSASAITIQAALLYTSSAGERRIRVHTMVLPVTNSAVEMVESFDIDCAMNLLSKQAIDIAQKTGIENARQRINQATIDIMKAAKSTAAPVVAHQMPQYGVPIAPQSQMQPVTIPSSLVLLPLYSMSLQKNVVVRGGTDTRIDERAYFQQLVQNMDIEETKVFIYPRMFSIHDITNDVGLPSDNADNDEVATAGKRQVRLPAMLNLSYEKLSSDGVFLLENGHDMFMWIGRNVNPAIINTLFGHASLDGVDLMTLSIVPENSDFSSRVYDVVEALREDRNRYMQLHFIKEGDGYAEAYFARYLVEDRANFSGGGLSYTEYHANVTRSVSGLPG